MFCIQCGTALAENARFCHACGTAAPVVPAGQPQAPAGAAPVYGQPVFPCFVYPVNTVLAPSAASAAPVQPAPQPEATPIYRRKKEEVAPQAAPDTEDVFDGEQVPEPQPVEDAPMTVWQTVCCLAALLCLPLGNIIFACVWGFRANEHPQRRTLARAALPFITLGLLVLFAALLWLTVNLNAISITLH